MCSGASKSKVGGIGWGGGGVIRSGKGKRDGEEGEEGLERGWGRGGEGWGRGLGSERRKLKMKGHFYQPYSFTVVHIDYRDEASLSVVHHRPLCMLLEICNRIRFRSATCLV